MPNGTPGQHPSQPQPAAVQQRTWPQPQPYQPSVQWQPGPPKLAQPKALSMGGGGTSINTDPLGLGKLAERMGGQQKKVGQQFIGQALPQSQDEAAQMEQARIVSERGGPLPTGGVFGGGGGAGNGGGNGGNGDGEPSGFGARPNAARDWSGPEFPGVTPSSLKGGLTGFGGEDL